MAELMPALEARIASMSNSDRGEHTRSAPSYDKCLFMVKLGRTTLGWPTDDIDGIIDKEIKSLTAAINLHGQHIRYLQTDSCRLQNCLERCHNDKSH